MLHGPYLKYSFSKVHRKRLKGGRGLRFLVDSNSNSEEGMQVLYNTAG
jgi:hypothetical protein